VLIYWDELKNLYEYDESLFHIVMPLSSIMQMTLLLTFTESQLQKEQFFVVKYDVKLIVVRHVDVGDNAIISETDEWQSCGTFSVTASWSCEQSWRLDRLRQITMFRCVVSCFNKLRCYHMNISPVILATLTVRHSADRLWAHHSRLPSPDPPRPCRHRHLLSLCVTVWFCVVYVSTWWHGCHGDSL